MRSVTLLALLVALLIAFSLLAQSAPQNTNYEWRPVESALGRSGKLQPDDTFKFSMPRRDLRVSVAGTPIKPGLALGSWIAFVGAPDHAMVMGDLVLTESEVEPVMIKLQQMGIQVTAVHNHLLNETPRVMYMHVESHGNAVQLGKAIHDALVLTKTPPPDSGSPATSPDSLGIDPAQIGQILGHKATVNGGIVQVSVPRSERIMDEGIEVPPSMGTATALNFQPTGNGHAAIAGDFALLPNEVNPVLKILRENGIQVTALHSHMLNDEPHLLFMHFWANDDAAKLAKGLRAALDQTKSAPAAVSRK